MYTKETTRDVSIDADLECNFLLDCVRAARAQGGFGADVSLLKINAPNQYPLGCVAGSFQHESLSLQVLVARCRNIGIQVQG